MADPQVPEGQARQAPPNPNGPEAHEPVDWQARAAEAEKKLGAVLNENKRIKTARDELSSNVKRWSGLEEAGHTPEQITELLSKQEQHTLEQAREKGEIDKLLENKDRTYQKQLKAKDDIIAAERDLNNKVLLDAVLMRELGNVCDPRLLEGAFALHRPKIVMIEDPESKYGRKAVASFGGDQMEVADFVKNWAETDENAIPYLKPSLASGGGPGGGASGGRVRYKPRSKMSAKEKSDAIDRLGKAAYDQLPWE